MRITSILEIVNIANRLLKENKIIEAPVDLELIAENLGLRIVTKNFSDNVSGALVYKNDEAMIVCNNNHGKNRRRFTIAHELGHFVLRHGRDGLFIDKQEHFIFRNEASATGEERQEVEANAFAAALLMPENLVKSEMNKLMEKGFDLYGEDVENSPLYMLSKIFEVSITAMSFRISNLKLFDTFN
jgi:Zn-dependent peptidase ImmA (M78 family)